MGSGRQTGGFDGWRGSSPVGNTGSLVTQIIAGAGISVSPPGGTGVVTVTNSLRTLATIYAYGLANTPAVDNNMVGNYADMYINTQGELEITQTFNTVGTDFDAFPPIKTQRQTTSQGVVMLQHLISQKYNGGGGTNDSGGSFDRYQLVNVGGVASNYADHQTFVNPSAANTIQYYKPTLPASTYDGPLAVDRWFLLNRKGSGATTQWYSNADGVQYRGCLLPPVANVSTIFAEQWGMSGIVGEPPIGSVIRIGAVGPASGPNDGVPIAGVDFVLSNSNFGSAQAAGTGGLWAATLTGGPQTVYTWSPTLNTSVVPLRVNNDTVATGQWLNVLGTETLASAAGLTWDAVYLNGGTLTLSGATSVTTTRGLTPVYVPAPTVTSASALTVDRASTVVIGGNPTAGGSTTITLPIALDVQGGAIVHDQTVGATNYARVRALFELTSYGTGWHLKSEAGGTGTAQDIIVDGQAANAALVGLSASVLAGSGAIAYQALGTTGSEQGSMVATIARASAAGMVLDAFKFSTTGTFSGVTNITTAAGVNAIVMSVPTYSGNGSAKTVTNAATLKIAGAPNPTSSLTITNAYSLWNVGLGRFDGNGTHVFELPADATVAGAQVGRIPVRIGGATMYLHYYDG